MKIKVLVVEPEKAPRLDYIENELEVMQEIVGGLIQTVKPVQFTDDAIIICNEEGKLLDLPVNMPLIDVYGNMYDVIVGTFFICNASEDSEEFTGLTDEQINKYFWTCM